MFSEFDIVEFEGAMVVVLVRTGDVVIEHAACG